ncbi:hypothetical protein ES332_A07G072200v1 [Gossypium tomentosum]|uniref:Uncharacterized protein n=1 Tax=Gossypium tomentosum TaxID=34277 RepID=A0A5D2PQJ8_GOSTO|nr:hypothetical protein ES332_A07G072200v1 [Gossypium tomentosum]
MALIRVPYPLQWGRPSFHAGDAVSVIAASFVALIESTGKFIAASRYASATPIPPSVHSRGVGWLEVAILLNGLFGTGTGSTASVENAGLLGLTRVRRRRVVQISVLFMLFLSVFGKFGAILASIPLPIVAALYCPLFAYVASAGLGLLQFCNLNSFRTKFILGFSLFIGLPISQYFNEYRLVSGMVQFILNLHGSTMSCEQYFHHRQLWQSWWLSSWIAPIVTGTTRSGEIMAAIGGKSSGASMQIPGLKTSTPCLLILIDIEGVAEDSISSSWKSQGLALLQVECYLMLHSMVVYLSWNLNLVLLK